MKTYKLLIIDDEEGETADVFSLPENYSNVKQVMTERVTTIEADTSLIDIIHIMHGKNIHTLPVVTAGEIKGVVGRRDVFHRYYKLLSKKKTRLKENMKAKKSR